MLKTRHILLLICLIPWSLSVQAKKLESVIDLNGKVPAEQAEQGIWDLASEHENNLSNSGELLESPEMEAYLESIVAKLMGEDLDKLGVSIDFIFVKRPSLSAWVYPYGTIAVHTGLLANLNNEAELAAIIGHEVAHFVHRHSYSEMILEKQQSALGKGLGLLATAAVAAKTGSVDTSLMNSGTFITELVTNGYSRKLEYEADETGLEYMRRGNYSREQGIDGFIALKQNDAYGAVNMGSLWSSHPKLDNRIKNLGKEVSKEKRQKIPPGATSSDMEYRKTIGNIYLINAQLDMSEHQFDRARKAIERFQSIQADDASSWYFSGEVDRKQYPDGPDFSARISKYQKAISLDPELALAYKELGMALRQQGNKAEAVNALEQYLNRSPQAVDAGIIRGYIQQLKTGA